MVWFTLGSRVASVVAGSVTLAVWLAGASTALASPGWAIQSTPNPPATGVLSSVSCTAAACSAVGYSTPEASLAEQWNGTNWTFQPSISLGAAMHPVLSGVSCTSANACTAVGSMKHIYCPLACNRGMQIVTGTMAMQWNGTGWSWVPTYPSQATPSSLSGVSCPSATACVAVGSSSSGTLAETWNGTAWTIQTTPSGPALSAVSCPSTNFCMAVGGSLAERWNGTNWTIQTTPNPPNGVAYNVLSGVSCTAANACRAVGYSVSTSGGVYQSLAEAWNGSTWTVQTTPHPTGATSGTLSAISCPAANACTAVGNYTNSVVGTQVTLAERWNGSTWTVQTTPNPNGATYSTLSGVSCTATTACTAVGDSINGSGTDVTLAEQYSG